MMVSDISLVPSGADFYILVDDDYKMVVPCSKAQLPVVEATLRRIYKSYVKVLSKKPTDLSGAILVCPATEYGG